MLKWSHPKRGWGSELFSPAMVLRVAVVNPTTLNGAGWKFAELPFDICCVSECSTTAGMQVSCSKEFNNYGLRITWGTPVPSHRAKANGDESLRGAALGVCVVSSKPLAVRPSRDLLPPQWLATCRLMVSFVQLPTFVARIITVYGVPGCSQNSVQRNLTLWTAIFAILRTSDMPTLIGGDCNIKPQSTEVWESISALGFVEAFAQHEAVCGFPLPHTCRGATSNDTLVYSCHFARCFQSSFVHQGGLFADHSPLIVSFDVQVPQFIHRTLQLPGAMSDIVLNSELFQFEQDKLCKARSFGTDLNLVNGSPTLTSDGFDTALQQVGRIFETAYDAAVHGLNSFVGDGCFVPVRQPEKVPRLSKRTPVPIPPRQAPRRARNGAYEPPNEVYRIRTLQWTKQMRRLEAFCHRFAKYHGGNFPVGVAHQSKTEWDVILASPGFRPSFSAWCLRNGICAVWLSYDGLQRDWLQSLCSGFRAALHKIAVQEKQLRSKVFQHTLDLDLLHFGGPLAYSMIKPPKPLPPGHFDLCDNFTASVFRCRGKSLPKIQVHGTRMPDTSLTCTAGAQAFKLRATDDVGVFEAVDLPKGCVTPFGFSQTHMVTDPDRIAKAFFEFWAPFWLRDSGDQCTDISAWPDFLRLCHALPDLGVVPSDEVQTLEEWRWAIKATKCNTARGVCGLSQPELNAFSDQIIGFLAQLMYAGSSLGFPDWLMLARVVMVPKCTGATSFSQMRPITVYSLLFRIWAKISARRLLQQWKTVVPRCITGGLPGRSCARLSLSNAIDVEHGLSIGAGLGGFSLDIAKCFNALGRLPALHLLRHGGFGPKHSQFWSLSLGKMTRTACFLDTSSCPSAATTGLPEGDPLAVCAIVMFGLLWASPLLSVGIRCSLFYDDWSWTSDRADHHILALRHTQDFLAALQLHSDPSKCWCWGSTPKARKAWEQVNLAVTGAPDTYRVSSSEKALGVLMHYTKQTTLGCQATRLEAGIHRLQRLQKLPVPPSQKAHLIQTGIWPVALFGADVVYVGAKHLNKLRSVATTALVGKTSATMPHLALATVSKHVCDPVLYLLIRTLGLWRSLMCHDELSLPSLRGYLANACDDPNLAFGPASALKCYLKHVNWTINGDGFVVDHLNRSLDLSVVSFKQVLAYLWDAWDVIVSALVRKRRDYPDWPELDLFNFRLLNLPEDPREVAVVHQQTTLSHLWDTQNSKWAPQAKDDLLPCPLCGGANSRAHFPCLCPGLTDLRNEHSAALDLVTSEFPHLIFLPVLSKHPKLRLLQTIHAARELPEPFNLFELWPQLDGFPVFYTDGSCIHPELPVARFSAFAIVLDCATADYHRRDLARVHSSRATTPDTFLAVQVAVTPGLQTINRAEFCAILQIVRSVPGATIFSDSSWAIGTFHAVRDAPHPSEHCMRDNFDLILILCALADEVDLANYDLFKIKSHLNDDEAEDSLHLYHIQGNRFADELARKGVEPGRSPLHATAHEVSDWYVRQKQLLLDVRPFLVQADILRLDGFSTASDSGNVRKRLTNDQLDTWQPDGFYMSIPDVPDEIASGFLPGASVLQCMLRWFRLLRWPHVDEKSGGISLFEMMVNFVGLSGCVIPRVAARGTVRPEYFDPMRDPAADLIPCTVQDGVRMMDHAIHFMKRAMDIDLVPPDNKVSRQFHWRFGHKKVLSGFRTRPALPELTVHMQAMSSAIQDGNLQAFCPFDASAVPWRVLGPADSTPHAVRVRIWLRLDNQARARK